MLFKTSESFAMNTRQSCQTSINKPSNLLSVPQIQAPSSVAAYVEGHFFVCDSKENSLYLLGPDGKTIQQKWSLANLLNSNDELLTVSVLGQKCVCATKFGFVLIFNIN